MAMKKMLIVIFALIMMSAPCFANLPAQEFRIGIMVPLTGAENFKGIAMLAAAKAAVENINRRGGVNGEKIALNVVDTKSTTDGLEDMARRLIVEHNPSVVIGPPFANEISALSNVFQNAATPLIAVSAPDAGMGLNTGGQPSYIFRLCDGQGNLPQALSKIIQQKFKWKRAAFIVNKENQASMSTAFFVENTMLRLGIKVVARVVFPQMTYGFKPYFAIAANFKPDIIFFAGDDDQTFLALMQASDILPKNIDIVTAGPSPAVYWRYADFDISRKFFLSFFNITDDAIRKKLGRARASESYRLGSLAPVHAVLTFDAVQWAADARRRSRGNMKSDMRDALASTKGLHLVHRDLTIGPDNSPVGTAATLCSLQELVKKNKRDVNQYIK